VSWGLDIEHEGRERMDWIEIVDGHTYNLEPMWRLAGIFEQHSDQLEGIRADVLADRAARGLMRAVSKPAEFKALAPANEWGSYEGFIEILTRTAIICAENRDGIVRWNG